MGFITILAASELGLSCGFFVQIQCFYYQSGWHRGVADVALA
ncbi:hypothetical protein [uncultured Deefgea sp.]|nr:hypothetical protein [uncultured Deefgea sp.]